MTEIWLGYKGWELRSEIFDWCEKTFGNYYEQAFDELTNNRRHWVFRSDYPQYQHYGSTDLSKRVYLIFHKDEYAVLFLLKWGEYKCSLED